MVAGVNLGNPLRVARWLHAGLSAGALRMAGFEGSLAGFDPSRVRLQLGEQPRRPAAPASIEAPSNRLAKAARDIKFFIIFSSFSANLLRL